MKKILVTGGSGQIGSAVARLAKNFDLLADSPTRLSLDLSNARSISNAVRSADYAAVINCGAYTAVDKAEQEADLAWRINADAPAILAEETARCGIPMIHVSTDYVFDGAKTVPYCEADQVNPIGVYGQTKEAGEAAVRQLNPHHAIVRTAWVISAGPANFLDTMLRLALDRDEVNVVNDQFGCPSSAEDIAYSLLHITTNMGDRAGTWHFVNGGEASWFDLAKHIFERTAKCGLRIPKLGAISTAEYPTPAKRPANSRLATFAFERDFGIKPRMWQDAVDAILDQRLAN